MNLKKILVLDADYSARLQIASKPGLLRSIASFFAHSGDSWFWTVGIVLVWWLGNPYWKARMIALGIGVLVTATLVMAIKFTVKRRRPESEWGNIYRATDPHSFPSGHAARSFMLAAMTIGLGPAWMAITLVIWAPLVALARVMMGVHYLSDVVAGAMFGVFMGWINLILVPVILGLLMLI